jgi:DNA-binding response OmpR family regulator
MRILLVDDEPDFLTTMDQWLRVHGHNPLTTTDSRDVLRMIDLHHFDLVCLDLLMPFIDGLQLIPEIRERKPHCPILVLSGVGDTRIVVAAAKEGIEDYLLKPIDFCKFDAILKRLDPES